jgi:hypothetical protein
LHTAPPASARTPSISTRSECSETEVTRTSGRPRRNYERGLDSAQRSRAHNSLQLAHKFESATSVTH